MAGVWNWTRGFACLLLVLGSCGREELGAASACDDLAPGDIVITEVHANPDGRDGEAEYVELFNASGELLSLDGLSLVTGRSVGTGESSHRFFEASMAPGDYLVVGNAPFDAMPPHLDYSYGSTLGSLRNSDALVSVRCDELLIDQVIYERTSDGRALELDGRFAPDDELNDDAARWCTTPEGVSEFSPHNFRYSGGSKQPMRVRGANRRMSGIWSATRDPPSRAGGGSAQRMDGQSRGFGR